MARTLLLRPLWNRSALLVSPPGVPGVLALDVKPTAVFMMIAAREASSQTSDLLGTALVALPVGSVRPAARSSQVAPLVI